jgi:hypothetical protein
MEEIRTMTIDTVLERVAALTAHLPPYAEIREGTDVHND